MAKRKTSKGGGFSWLTLVVVIIATAILCGLGAWQVQRLQWKTQLLARIDALKYAPAEPLNVALNHLQAGRDVDFIRVVTPCEPTPPAPAARIYTVSDAGPAWRPVVVCRIKFAAYPAVLLDLGVEANEARANHEALAPPPVVTGVLRKATKVKPFMAMQPTNPGEFGWRDAKGIAGYLGAPEAAPVFLSLEQPTAAPGIKPQPAPVDIPNNHLGYAITWFGLAAALIGVYVAALLRRGRKAK